MLPGGFFRALARVNRDADALVKVAAGEFDPVSRGEIGDSWLGKVKPPKRQQIAR